MPGEILPDGQGGDAGASQGGQPPEAGGQLPPQPQGSERRFTQQELDAIIADRLRREASKFADYDELKTKATEYDSIQEKSKSELQKEKERAARAEAERDAARTEAQSARIHAAITAEATAQGAVDAEAVVALIESGSVTVEDGKVKGAKEAVEALLAKKAWLTGGKKETRPGGEFGGDDPATLPDKIRELEAQGKWAEARDLKMRVGFEAMASGRRT